MKKKLLISIIVLVGIALLWGFNAFNVFRDAKYSDDDLGASLSPVPSVSNQPNIPNKYPPASCYLAGSIEFLAPNLSQNKDADIVYKNIDSVARHIIWSVSPQDDLSVGPNLFASLPVPNGTEDVTVGLPASPKAKNYTLTAKVTYGRFVNGNLEIKEAPCSG